MYRDKTTVVTKSGMGLATPLTLIFVVAKLVGLIDWPWIWVFAPVWIPIVVVILIALVLVCIGAIMGLYEHRKSTAFRRNARANQRRYLKTKADAEKAVADMNKRAAKDEAKKLKEQAKAEERLKKQKAKEPESWL